MPSHAVLEILSSVAEGSLLPGEALEKLRIPMVQDSLHGLSLDVQREFRTGLGEVVFAEGKSDAALISAVTALGECGPVLATRVDPDQGALLQATFPNGRHCPEGRLFAHNTPEHIDKKLLPPWPATGDILVLSAGAADMPVAMEAFGTLAFHGASCGCILDVGVAGMHRLVPHLPALQEARLIIVVAGMEGALPGVVAGLVTAPVLAVPTSIGYGVGAKGQAALATMLCTCVPGVSVFNIDNGFGAAAFALKILRQIEKGG